MRDFSLLTMLLTMIVLTSIFNYGAAYMGDSQVQAGNTAVLVNTTLADSPDTGWGFMGPIVLVWNYLKGLMSWFDAMGNLMNAMGNPEPLGPILTWGWRVAWIMLVISFIRAYRA